MKNLHLANAKIIKVKIVKNKTKKDKQVGFELTLPRGMPVLLSVAYILGCQYWLLLTKFNKPRSQGFNCIQLIIYYQMFCIFCYYKERAIAGSIHGTRV